MSSETPCHTTSRQETPPITVGRHPKPRPDDWQPQFDCMAHKQEVLVWQFCAEIAGPKGRPGCPPDPVRLLEMAQALYEAEREDAAS